MKLSSMFLNTLKEDPKDADVISHKLMLRAGMIKKVSSGIYSYLPYGLAALRKVEAIVREEMNNIGAQEVLLPGVQPAELWEESGRWSMYGKELLRFNDRKGASFAIGPTHEEVITDLVRGDVRSYRDLPIILYQIQTKFRDEIRPRFGLIRAREFIMKDAYSFDMDENSSEKSYNAMYSAYERIFEKCGLKFRAVEAATGAIGGAFSHEFMVLADTGEDFILSCNNCGYAANIEKAEVSRPPSLKFGDAPKGKPQKVHTPGIKTVEEVCNFLGVVSENIIKTMIYNTDIGTIAALVRGDHEVNEVKLRQALECQGLELADDKTIEAITYAPRGFAGPVGLNINIIADMALVNNGPFVTGANEEDYHLKGVWLSRDATITAIDDIRIANPGDSCPRCEKGLLEEVKGIEVGHIFKLGTKYSSAMSAMFLDEKGSQRPIVMGCYGIGIGRTVAAA
ncbi:MAG: proline--tRNA ligase, partial [Deltaproteobacteria bacterium]|nr:proline--tRNA ligase [Deltaproteobacteria bacterium]